MSQLTLFESTESLLADDERGRIAYRPGFVDAATAAAWFAEVRSGVEWRAERRMMYDREVDVPRLIGHFRLDSPARVPAAIRSSCATCCRRLSTRAVSPICPIPPKRRRWRISTRLRPKTAPWFAMPRCSG